jgi:hypothetical protein
MDFGLPVLASDRIITDALPVEYPLETFPAGDATALAERLAAALRRAPRQAAPVQASDGWPELLQLIERAARDICQAK